MSSRRTFMEGVASMAAANWAEADYDIEDAENWDPVQGGLYIVDEFTPSQIITTATVHADDPFHRVNCEIFPEQLPERDVIISYDPSAVNVEIDGSGEDRRGGSLASLTPEQAREVAAAIYQAAEELDRRPGGP